MNCSMGSYDNAFQAIELCFQRISALLLGTFEFYYSGTMGLFKSNHFSRDATRDFIARKRRPQPRTYIPVIAKPNCYWGLCRPRSMTN
jgi:hypothetical protein